MAPPAIAPAAAPIAALASNDEVEEAITALRRGLRDTDDAQARTLLGLLYHQQGRLAEAMDAYRLAIATDGKRINLPGGLPIIIDGHVIGAIGIGSGTGAQDLEVAQAGIAALEGTQKFD